MIRFLCPGCRAKVQAPDEKKGLAALCPKCRRLFNVPPASMPGLETAAPASSTPSAPPPLQAALVQLVQEPPATPVVEAPLDQGSLVEVPVVEASLVEVPLPETAPALIEAPLTAAPMRATQAPRQSITPFAKRVNKRNKRPLLIGAGVGLIVLAGVLVIFRFNKPPQPAVAKVAEPEKKPIAPPPQVVPAEQKPISTRYYPNTQPSLPPPPKPQLAHAPDSSSAALRRKSAFASSAIPHSGGPVRQPSADPGPKIKQNNIRLATPTKRFDTSPFLTPPVQVENTVYFASRDGDFYTVDATTLKFEQRRLGKTVKRLFLDGSELKAQIANGPDLTILQLEKPIEVSDPEDVEAGGRVTMIDGQPLPKAWYERHDYFHQVVFHGGKYYQPAPVSVKTLEDGEIVDYISSVPGLNHWRIALPPSGPLGYDITSVYELDENLCPTRRIFNLQMYTSGSARANECFLAGDGKTLCFVQQTNDKRRMMIWSLDGQTKLREVPAVLAKNGQDDEPPLNLKDPRQISGRLRAVGGGYVFCGTELTWLPVGEGNVMQFRPNEETKTIISAGRKVTSNARDRYGLLNVTPAAIVGEKIIVGYGGGGIFVFDASGFSAGKETPKIADTPAGELP